MDSATWVKSYGDYLFSYCLFRVRHRETAEDLVQETFLAAFAARANFTGSSSVKTWLVAILKNKIIDHYRKKDVLKDAGDYLADSESDFSRNFFDESNGHWLREGAPQPWSKAADAEVHQEEFLRVLGACIDKMPSKLAPVFVSKFIDDEDSETICKVYGLSPSNYWVILHRAKVLIRSCLEKNWFLTDGQKDIPL